MKRLPRERTCFLLETFARVEENCADEERLDEVFVEHLADLGAGRAEDISLYLGLRGDKYVVVADLRLLRFLHGFIKKIFRANVGGGRIFSIRRGAQQQ